MPIRAKLKDADHDTLLEIANIAVEALEHHGEKSQPTVVEDATKIVRITVDIGWTGSCARVALSEICEKLGEETPDKWSWNETDNS